MRRLPAKDPMRIGTMMILRHGLRATAVARERLSEAVAAGDAAGCELWRQVDAAIGDIRANSRVSDERRATLGV